MRSIFDAIERLGPAGIVVKAIVAALIAIGAILAFILVRRAYRKNYFARRDARALHFQRHWVALVSGQIPLMQWRNNPFDRRIIESLALDALEAAEPGEAAQLLRFLRSSGLLQKQIHAAQKHRGWRRQGAMVALGRTRAPEGIPALAQGLRDASAETRLAALRGLGRTSLPAAADEILFWVAEAGLVVPPLPLENALINCCRECPNVLLARMRGAPGPLREIFARVFAEVATPALEAEILEIAGDASPEVRASAARALAHAEPKTALPVLIELLADPVWIVRLRAAVALGQLRNPLAIPSLIRALTDPHRLVRLRAAQAIVEQDTDPFATFQRVVETGDAYAQDAYITAAENAGKYNALLHALRRHPGLDESYRDALLAAAAFRLNAGEPRRANSRSSDMVRG